MHILHGTWIPDEVDEFRQYGMFYLWVETARNSRHGPQADCLTAPELAELLAHDCQLAANAKTLRPLIQPRYLLLPTADGSLLPSPLLAQAAGLPLPAADTPLTLQAHEVSCYGLRNTLTELKDLHYLCNYRLTDVRAGADLIFWYHASRLVADVLRREQYIPALRYQQTATGFAVYPGWEILSSDYEAALTPLQARMPGLCRAGAVKAPTTDKLYDSTGLLRHFCECLLGRQISRLAETNAFNQRVAATLLDDCLHPLNVQDTRSTPPARLRYQQWLRWRQALNHGVTGTFQLGLQLLEAADEHTPWQLHFLATSRRDPSLQLPLHQYWQQRAVQTLAHSEFGQDFEQHLLLALGYAARLYPRLWDGLDSDRPVGVSLSLQDAFAFLKEHAWVLQEAGMRILAPAWWTPEGRARAKLRLRTSDPEKISDSAGRGYFSLDTLVHYRYELALGGEPVSPQEWRRLVDAKSPLVQFRGQWLELDRERMQHLLNFWEQHGDDAKMSLAELFHRAAQGDDEIDVSHASALNALLATLDNPGRLTPVDDPPDLQGRLRDYQKRGVAWLSFLEERGLGACLADDMGLGKSLQVLTRLLIAGERRGTTLLIAPTSVLGNWRQEAARFTPQIKVLVHHGPQRLSDPAAFAAACQAHDVIVTSYTLARMDAALLHGITWQRVVIDEAQNIKNPKTAQTKAILKLKAAARLALTGTPIENRLLDLWSIFNFLNPGYLGNETRFRRDFELPIQRNNDSQQASMLRKLVQPFILRRVKTDSNIIKDLPDKVENRQFCQLTREQASLYQAVVDDVAQQLELAEGMKRRGLMLATLTRLKQICNHPRQFLQDNSAFDPDRSHKLARLLEMLDEVVQEGDSALIFTQFTEIGAALEKLLHSRYRTFYLHGGTPQQRREQMIHDFQSGSGQAVFVLSLKAGGVGITLTRANQVFHFDRWWNPAVEDQATDRAYRIGQHRNVFVHKFVTLGTLEERIDRLIEDKKAVAGSIVGNDESWLTELSNERFKELIRLNRAAVLE